MVVVAKSKLHTLRPKNFFSTPLVRLLSCLLLLAFSAPLPAVEIVNDVTGLNPVAVERVAVPGTVSELQELVRAHPGPISIGGARFSHGGQTSLQDALFIDMRRLNRILAIDAAGRTVTVQPGATWREVQEAIDVHDLSVMIMQSYANFTVGGALSVNCHGRYAGKGPILSSVRELKLLTAEGQIHTASPAELPEVFYGVIGGYGALGIIVEATLDLAENKPLRRQVRWMPAAEYPAWFGAEIRPSDSAVFHNANLYPPRYEQILSITWSETTAAPTIPQRLMPVREPSFTSKLKILLLSELPFGKRLRQHVIDRRAAKKEMIVWRNYEASYDTSMLEPFSRRRSTYALQEYFVPVAHYQEFLERLREILQSHDVNVINLSIRHSPPDPGALLAWAREECFAFVIYYKQGTSETAKARVGRWARALTDAALSHGGSYYLPYQPHATQAQFEAAYPDAERLVRLKRRLDPEGKFRSQFINAYFPLN